MTKQTDLSNDIMNTEKNTSDGQAEDQAVNEIQGNVTGQFSIFDQEISGTLFSQDTEESVDYAAEEEVEKLTPEPTPTPAVEEPEEQSTEAENTATEITSGAVLSAQKEKEETESDYYIPQFDIAYDEKNAQEEQKTESPAHTDSFSSEDNNITNQLVEFREIKNKSVLPSFETPYLYKGKKGEHIRHRLSVPTDRNPKKERMKRNIISFGITIIVALILAFLLRSFVFVLATVDGPSMEPTLQNNEKILVTRYSYYFHEIEHGDVIVCKFDNENYPNYYVKRVIALGGETVKIQNGIVYVNNVPLEEPYIKEAPRNDMEEVLVPAGYVFVMGDNRNNSTDSRKSFIGPIAEDLVIGKARCILFPFSNFGSIEE